MVVVDKVRYDKHGFLGTDGKWYANKFKEFIVSKGDEVEVVMKGDFLQEVKVINKAPEAKPSTNNNSQPREFHLSPEEVKLRALEFAHSFEPNGTMESLLKIANEIVRWVEASVKEVKDGL